MKKKLYYKADPRESDEMSLMESIYSDACISDRNDGIDEGAPDDEVEDE